MPRSDSSIAQLPYTSYSRLECYSHCSAKYKNRYIDKIKVDRPLQMALIKGTLFHSCLEAYNDLEHPSPESKFDIFTAALEGWLYEIGFDVTLSELTEMSRFAKGYGEVITRASVRGKPGERILNSDGSVPKSLEDYPPKSFTKALQERGINPSILYWNNWAASRKDEFWENSFAFLIGECYSFFEAFEWAEWIQKSVGVEYEVSTANHNLVKFSTNANGEDIYLRSYIDWIALTKSSQVAFIDYKTGKTKPTPNDVLHHPQLNIYCKASLELFGSIPDYIVIYHAASAEYISAVPDIKIVNSIYELLVSMQDGIEDGVFQRSHPGMFNSPCKTYMFKTKQFEYCEYIDTCWPLFKQTSENNS